MYVCKGRPLRWELVELVDGRRSLAGRWTCGWDLCPLPAWDVDVREGFESRKRVWLTRGSKKRHRAKTLKYDNDPRLYHRAHGDRKSYAIDELLSDKPSDYKE